MSISENYNAISKRIAGAAAKAGREPSEITLVAAAKGQPIEHIKEYTVVASPIHLGHNYVQEFLGQQTATQSGGILATSGKDIHWHFIGRLQRNKVQKIVGKVELIHSVDSLALATEIDKRAKAKGCVQKILLEVNLGGETTKAGVPSAELSQLFQEARELPNVSLAGLMTIPPPDSSDDAGSGPRKYFEELQTMATDLENKFGLNGLELSMGMSSDFEIAIECGATIIRIGTALLGARPPKNN